MGSTTSEPGEDFLPDDTPPNLKHNVVIVQEGELLSTPLTHRNSPHTEARIAQVQDLGYQIVFL